MYNVHVHVHVNSVIETRQRKTTTPKDSWRKNELSQAGLETTICTCTYTVSDSNAKQGPEHCRHESIGNHNSLGRERPSGLDVKQFPNVQDMFQLIPGLISCAGVTGSVGITRHACAIHIAGLMYMYMYM